MRVRHMMETLNIAAWASIDHMSFLADRSNVSPLRERLLPILLFYWQMSQQGALDVHTTDEILELLVALQKNQQTILLVTHDLCGYLCQSGIVLP